MAQSTSPQSGTRSFDYPSLEKPAIIFPNSSLVVRPNGYVLHVSVSVESRYKIYTGDIFHLPGFISSVEDRSNPKNIQAEETKLAFPASVRLTPVQWNGENAFLVELEEEGEADQQAGSGLCESGTGCQETLEGNPALFSRFLTHDSPLRAAETQFQGLLETLRMVAILLKLDGTILSVNNFVLELTGYGREEAIGKNWFDLMLPDEERPVVQNMFQQMVEQNIVEPYAQNHILTRSGERRLIAFNSSLLYDPMGNLTGIASLGEDITERDRAEKIQETVYFISQQASSIYTTEELYPVIHQGLAQIMPVDNFFISLYDPIQDTVSFPYYIDQYDSPPGQTPAGRGLTEYVLRTGRPLLTSPEIFDDLIARGEVEPVGSRPVDWLGVPLKIGSRTIGVMVVQSYSEWTRFDQRDLQMLDFVSTQIAMTIERKRAEQALRENEEKYRALVEAASSAIFLETRDGKILDSNGAACQMLGYTKEELLQMHVKDIVPEHVLKTLSFAVREEDELGRYHWESVNQHKDGTMIPVDVSTRLVEIGGQTFSVVFIDNISDRKQREREMEAIAGVSAALRTAITLADILPVILQQLVDRLSVHGAFISLRNPASGEVRVELGCGTWAALNGKDLPDRPSLCCQVLETGKMYFNNQANHDDLFPFPDLIDGVQAIASVPLITQGQIYGALTVGYERPIQPAEVNILTAISDIAASAIQRARLFEKTSQQAKELSEAYDATIEGWALALELRDKETQGHSRNVTAMTLRLAAVLGLDEEARVHIRRGALLHDIGKMAIPDNILLKPGPLTDEEWITMRKHPQYAYQMLSSIRYLHPALDIPCCHHEKWDGTGYPRGLQGEAIPLYARIFAVVDVMDALTSNRPYRPAWTRDEALNYIQRQANKHFDPRVVEAFLKLFPNEEAG
jgi:PAS domain S-box-containing protein/putative nucleotidyltransferase with HDIG domain